MPSTARSSQRSFDINILGDELEQSRIALEHNLQHTDLSLHLSSAPDADNDDYSIEYPRHHSGPDPSFSAFHSVDRDERSFVSEEGLSHLHAWSYRTGDEEDGIHPFAGGETFSTAAHHASALTLSAGLGGRGHRRDISLSGAEYDPDRPLQDLVAHVDSRFSLLEGENTRSRGHLSSHVPFDPVIGDNTAQIDNALSSRLSGAALPRSPQSSSSSNSGSEPETPDPTSPSSRPKLSDALSHLTFSPKRPRSPAIASANSRSSSPALSLNRSYRSRESNSVRLKRHRRAPPVQAPAPYKPKAAVMQDEEPTPRARKMHSSGLPQPAITVRPPTPSTANSKFTKLARGIAHEIGIEQSRWNPSRDKDFDPDSVEGEIGARAHSTIREKPKLKPVSGGQFNARPPFDKPNVSSRWHGSSAPVHLPDVTGLTSAIASPAKGGMQYYEYEDDDDEYGDGKARLLATLTVVQQKLAHLDAENGTSRRRMRELELELEACKQEVMRERERVIRHEEMLAKHMRESETARFERGRASAQDNAADRQRYKKAVEEKKALEALINTLHTHMSRLTSELAAHQTLLDELRSVREADSHTLREKVHEVDRLRNEVEKVAGEVEVLKGVVEEGLRERRERSQVHIQPVVDLHDPQQNQRTGQEPEEPEEQHLEDKRQDCHQDDSTDTEEDMELASPATSLIPELPEGRRIGVDRTMQTDHATAGTSQLVGSTSRRFINDTELERISTEMEERRSERSASQASTPSNSLSRSHSSYRERESQSRSTRSASLASSVSATDRSASRSSLYRPASEDGRTGLPRVQASSPVPPPTKASQRLRRHFSSPSAAELEHNRGSRPPAPIPAQASGDHVRDDSRPTRKSKPSQRKRNAQEPKPASTPFPQIRGENLERLFFSAPEHNVKTCRVCSRRRRPESPTVEALQRPLWYPASRGREVRVEDMRQADDDEGFAEGSDDGNLYETHDSGKGKGRDTAAPQAENLEFLRKDGSKDRLPPQTVLVRVLRELEDDFTHYKGIYTELADQYKLMDPASNVVKRNVLAEHLREVIDVLEQKVGDQIASLYDLLTFEDKPVSQSVVPDKSGKQRQPSESAAGPSGVGRDHIVKKHIVIPI
ncbi:hypothetical protein EVG20_g2673 [Dentipellis fragilis]|uniref:Cep57 centrosome microtubule-binding domain-containing protein n=1 Tax=Dentipellis fragilis TaxID=205917 RepID=A0A4Y9Z737_9AGAM|nr:hypothetical protein EVG20_g2673 [Dentipellis fragilis]